MLTLSRIARRINLPFQSYNLWRSSAQDFADVTAHMQTMESMKSKRFCIEFENGPIYLLPSYDGIEASGAISDVEVDIFSRKNGLFYITSFMKGISFAGSISRHERLKKTLRALLPPEAEIISGLAYNSDGFERGYFIRTPFHRDEFFSELTEKTKTDDLQILVSKFTQNSDPGNLLAEHVVGWNSRPNQLTSNDLRPVRSLPDIHPAFQSCETNSVYHDIQRCYNVLNEYKSTEEVKELIQICDSYIKKAPNGDECLPLKQKSPVIVIEGLDATGKTTLTKNLGKHLDAVVLKSPAECLCHLRPKFDSYPQLLRRAFYSLGNYAFAKMVHDAAEDGIVIVDRFWNSTAAYAIATDVGTGGPECLLPAGHWVYSWPMDLLKPDAIFLLSISDEERRRRLKGRGTEKTDEEIMLEVSSPFRKRLEEAYARMENPSLQKIDAGGNIDNVLDKTLEKLKSLDLI